jgi:hypothetical protein
MPILSSTFHLFLNPSRIQIRTQFSCGSQFITVIGPTRSFLLPIFSLSPLYASLLLSLGHYNFFGNTTYGHHGRLFKLTHGKTPIQANKSPKSQYNNTKKNLIHISVMIQKTQQNPAQHHHTLLLVLGSGTATLLGICSSRNRVCVIVPVRKRRKGEKKKKIEKEEI